MNRLLPFLLALLVVDLAVASGTNSVEMLTETVTTVNQSLRSHDYSNTVQRLFPLTNETEIASAVIHLQRPKCLAGYEQLFAQLGNIKPTFDGEPARVACFKCPKPIVVSTNSWDRYDRMEVIFVFDGGRWVFHDPSFEKKLGRRMTSTENGDFRTPP